VSFNVSQIVFGDPQISFKGHSSKQLSKGPRTSYNFLAISAFLLTLASFAFSVSSVSSMK